MMLKERSNQWARLKLLLLLPAGLIALQMNARNIESASDESTVINSETSMPLSGKSTESNSENQEKIEYYIVLNEGVTVAKRERDQRGMVIIKDDKGMRMTPEEYNAFFENVKTMDTPTDFTDGKKVTLTMSVGYYLENGELQQEKPRYHLLTQEQKVELMRISLQKTKQKETPPPPPPSPKYKMRLQEILDKELQQRDDSPNTGQKEETPPPPPPSSKEK